MIIDHKINSKDKMNISIIGFGNMAQAIAQGLSKDETNVLRASAPSLSIGINKMGIQTHHDNLATTADADVIILAVKPSQMAAVLVEISPTLPAHCLMISVAAGLRLSWLAERMKPGMAIVRAMPNIAAQVGQAATPLIANEWVTALQKQETEQIFTSIGLSTWLDQERDMETFTALSGSGPAYVFLFMELMIRAAIDLGLTEAVATTFTLQTFKGALSLASLSELSLDALRKKVTSPAGTTAVAIDVLMSQGLDKLITAAMQAAHERACTLGR